MVASEFAESGFTARINRHLILSTVMAVLLASVVSAGYALLEFNIALRPALEKKAGAVAETIRGDLLLAAGANIPFDRIVGMEKYLSEAVEEYPEIVYIAVTDDLAMEIYLGGDEWARAEIVQGGNSAGDRPDFSFLLDSLTGRTAGISEITVPVADGGITYGAIAVGLDGQFINSQLVDVFFDILIVLIAVLLVSVEIVIVLILIYVARPIAKLEEVVSRQAGGDFATGAWAYTRDEAGKFVAYLNDSAASLHRKYKELASLGRGESGPAGKRVAEIGDRFNLRMILGGDEGKGSLIDARIPLFVFSFAEELQKSFMPLYVNELYEPIPYLSREMVIGLPIAIFMLVIALVTPFAGGWADKYGGKRMFLIGLIPAIAGYVGAGMAQSIEALLAWRSMTAFGYAIIVIACQGYIAAIVDSENRAKGMAIFVGVLMSATMTGTAIGGILADRIGYRPVFFVAAGFAVVAGLLAYAMLMGGVRDTAAKKSDAGPGNMLRLFRNWRFVSLVLACAIPAKIILTGFLYYYVPLYLASLEATPAAIGRVMMVYALVIIPLSPIASRYADRMNSPVGMVVFGTILSGAVLIALHGQDSTWAVLLAVATMGVAHSLIKAPLIAAVLEAAEEVPGVGRTASLGVLRTVERAGSFIGPLLVALLLSRFGFADAMSAVGIMVVAAGLFLGVYLKFAAPLTGRERI